MAGAGGDARFLAVARAGEPCLRCDECDPVCDARLHALALKGALVDPPALQRLGLSVQQLDAGVFALRSRGGALPGAYVQAGEGGWCQRFLDRISAVPSAGGGQNTCCAMYALERTLVYCTQARSSGVRLLVQAWDNFDRDVVYGAVQGTGVLCVEDPEWDVRGYSITLRLRHLQEEETELLLRCTPVRLWASMVYVAISVAWRSADTRTS